MQRDPWTKRDDLIAHFLPKDGGLDYFPLPNTFADCLVFVSSCICPLCELFTFDNLVKKITEQPQK